MDESHDHQDVTDDEFSVIKHHVYLTYKLLKDIDGFEHICAWASNHHEKLDGSGYHFGENGEELDFNSRLLACLDIYQALTEVRPYHEGRDHKTAMNMLSDMGDKGLLDTDIIRDLDSLRRVHTPAPWGGTKGCTLSQIPYENNHTPSALRRGWLIQRLP
jgi:HD-GYP domain-containing protein (c-di-GMP phosphodiesterase class II)